MCEFNERNSFGCDMEQLEEELTIKLQIPNIDNYDGDCNILYTDVGDRIISDNNRIWTERKRIDLKRYILKYYNNKLYPCVYTNGKEIIYENPPSYKTITHYVIRSTILKERSIRISIDCEDGYYWLKGEVENIRDDENDFLRIYDYYARMYNVEIKYDIIPTSEMTSITPRGFRIKEKGLLIFFQNFY